eukprot:6884039-Pyramimonas_sp.AAC.1
MSGGLGLPSCFRFMRCLRCRLRCSCDVDAMYMCSLMCAPRVASYWRVKPKSIVAMCPQSYEGASRSNTSSVASA